MGSQRDLPTVQIHCFPSGDGEFDRATRSALAAAFPDATDLRSLADVVDARLRRSYPNSRIVAQDGFATFGPREHVWYVYRDGRVRPTDERRDRMYRSVAEARRTMAAAETTMDHSRTIARDAGFEAKPPIPDGPIRPVRRPPAPRPPSAPRRRPNQDEG